MSRSILLWLGVGLLRLSPCQGRAYLWAHVVQRPHRKTTLDHHLAIFIQFDARPKVRKLLRTAVRMPASRSTPPPSLPPPLQAYLEMPLRINQDVVRLDVSVSVAHLVEASSAKITSAV